jgi:hypothetical protein
MLALQIVETEAGRLDLLDRAIDVPQVDRVELYRVIRRRREVGHLPRARVVDWRAVHRGQRGIVVECRV